MTIYNTYYNIQRYKMTNLRHNSPTCPLTNCIPSDQHINLPPQCNNSKQNTISNFMENGLEVTVLTHSPYNQVSSTSTTVYARNVWHFVRKSFYLKTSLVPILKQTSMDPYFLWPFIFYSSSEQHTFSSNSQADFLSKSDARLEESAFRSPQ